MPEVRIGPITRLAQNLFISPSALAQHAALGAFDDVAGAARPGQPPIAAVGTASLAALADAGLEALDPEGTFYLYLDISLDRAAGKLDLPPAAGRDRRRPHARDGLRPGAGGTLAAGSRSPAPKTMSHVPPTGSPAGA